MDTHRSARPGLNREDVHVLPEWGRGSLLPGFPDSPLGHHLPSLDLHLPSLGPHHPSLGHHHPSLGHHHPSLGPHHPSLGHHHPSLGHHHPSLGHHHPSLGPHHPSLGHDLPSLDLHLPSLGPHHPSLGHHHPSLGHHHPSLGPHHPSLGHHHPSLGHHHPSLGPHHPSLGHHHPSLGPHHPSLGPHHPSLGHHHPSLGHHHPSLGPHHLSSDNRDTGVSVCVRYMADSSDFVNLFTLDKYKYSRSLKLTQNRGSVYTLNNYYFEMTMTTKFQLWPNYQQNMWTSVCLTLDGSNNVAQLFRDSSMSVRMVMPSRLEWSGDPLIEFPGFSGQMTDLQVWDYPLGYKEIYNYMRRGAFRPSRGSLLTWSNINFSNGGNSLLEDEYDVLAQQPMRGGGGGEKRGGRGGRLRKRKFSAEESQEMKGRLMI
ncbi:uncharacterized protein LOC115388680 isoform X2 [Salarias fasciatus]|uniref:uncharacterized protein LOC115388680 isoform X2 n=1 Tax=Salarias fasciatus TaxID=181472 RepID=UPI0011768902|nr:uncharacterized protein LOC115388680 isoform X2 [Salarias fasciatus]